MHIWRASLKKNKDGSYDFASATPVVLTADGQTEMFTDERGYACSIPLAYGTYIVRGDHHTAQLQTSR